jgi:hypothetical protein
MPAIGWVGVLSVARIVGANAMWDWVVMPIFLLIGLAGPLDSL